ncbi:MAG: DUF2283 domain-containing protein [Chloroherpetonaceae bacterium]|nr:DUF2283 domain-containing protein [Chloroherpetonaceae bacterium]
MKISYDKSVDILRIEFSGAKIKESDEIKKGLILDFDKDGNIVGLEMLHASNNLQFPLFIEVENEKMIQSIQ